MLQSKHEMHTAYHKAEKSLIIQKCIFSGTYTELLFPIMDESTGMYFDARFFPSWDWGELISQLAGGSLTSGRMYTARLGMADMVLYDRRDLYVTNLETFIFGSDMEAVERAFVAVFQGQAGELIISFIFKNVLKFWLKNKNVLKFWLKNKNVLKFWLILSIIMKT